MPGDPNKKDIPDKKGANYYPFGLTMAGISDKALKTQYAENKYRFNNGSELQKNEFSDGSGLELYATDFRPLNVQIGRFVQIDELSQLDLRLSPYTYAEDDPNLFNDPTGLFSDTTHVQNLQPVVVNDRSLDVTGGQVLHPRTNWWWTALWRGNYRTLHGYLHDWVVDNNGYLTGKWAPIAHAIDLPYGEKPINLKSLKGLINPKNWIRARYLIYRRLEEGLLYIGKAKNSLNYRYTLKEIEELSAQVIKGLENLPDNATALGVEQLIIDLNGGKEVLGNINNATTKQAYLDAGKAWLEENVPNWKEEFKFQ